MCRKVNVFCRMAPVLFTLFVFIWYTKRRQAKQKHNKIGFGYYYAQENILSKNGQNKRLIQIKYKSVTLITFGDLLSEKYFMFNIN